MHGHYFEIKKYVLPKSFNLCFNVFSCILCSKCKKTTQFLNNWGRGGLFIVTKCTDKNCETFLPPIKNRNHLFNLE